MAGFKETPRQKMIGMMYLVLTALLALNVSKEILDAFVIVNDSVEITSQNFSKKVKDLHDDFEMQYSQNQEKVKPYFDKALLAEKYSEELIKYVDSVKYYIIAETEDIPYDTAKIRTLKYVKNKDNYDIPTRLLVGEEGFTVRTGYVLQRRIDEYRKNMMALIPEKEQEHFKMGLRTDGDYTDADGVKLSWVRYNFYHTILAADVTIFNKIKNDVLNTEYDVVSYFFQGITKKDFKFNRIDAKIIPESRLVFQGDPFKAEVIVAALDDNSQPEVDYVIGVDKWDDNLINSAITVQGDTGMVVLDIGTKGKQPREYKFAGRIGIKKPNSTEMDYHYFSSSFYVAEPSANVAATKMNVFYRGVDNPIKISAAGVPQSELKYSIVGDGKISKTKDGLVVQGLTKKTVQEVSVKVFSGEGADRVNLGDQMFRVKDLPDPSVYIRGMTGTDRVAKQSFLVNPYLLCALPEYVNFEFKYKVVSFSMVTTKGGDTFIKHSNSGQLSAEMKEYVRTARKNTMIVFTDIKVQGPIERRDIKPFVIKLN